MNDELTQAAKIAFASHYTFYLKSHYSHWNVEGIHFQELHSLFETIYTEVYGAVDEFAEKIRSLGAYAPGSNSRFSMLTRIEDETRVLPGEAMVAELLEDADKMVKILKIVYDQAEAAGEHGFSNFLAERMSSFRTHAWKLRSTLK